MTPSRITGVACKVCGADNAGNHYNGVVCSCCRIFFLRHTRRTKQTSCKWQGKCEIIPGAPDNCQSCRYRKCLEADMNPKEVGKLAKIKQMYMKKMEERNYGSPTSIAMETTMMDNTFLDEGVFNQQTEVFHTFENESEIYEPIPEWVNSSVSAGFFVLNSLENAQSATEYSNHLLSLQDFINNPNGLDPIDVYAYLDVSFSNVLLNSQACSSRMASYKDKFDFNPNSHFSMKHSYCRAVTHYADFVTAAPELYTLFEQDKMKLLQYNHMNVTFLTHLFEMWQTRLSNTALCARAQRFPLNPMDQNQVNNLVQKLQFYRKNFSETMERLGVMPGEIVILKFIVLFTPPTNVSDNGLTIINNARNKYCQLLSGFILENCPSITAGCHTERMRELLGLIRILKESSFFISQLFTEFVTANVGDLAGQLTYDLHIRHY